MQGRAPLGQAVFGMFDPLDGSKILPKALETISIERLAGNEHLRIGMLRRAKFLPGAPRRHVVENLRLEKLHAGKHQLAHRADGVGGNSAFEEAMNSARAV